MRAKEEWELRGEIGNVVVEVYTPAVEDCCELTVCYRELHWFRDCHLDDCPPPSIIRSAQEESEARTERRIGRPQIKHDEDVEDFEGPVYRAHGQESFRQKLQLGQKTETAGPRTSLWSKVDAWLYDANVHVHMGCGSVSLGFFDSYKQDSCIVIKEAAFTRASTPETIATMTKEKDALSLSVFGFTLHSSKLLAITSFFLSVSILPHCRQKISLMLETNTLNTFIKQYKEFYREKLELVRTKRQRRGSKEEPKRRPARNTCNPIQVFMRNRGKGPKFMQRQPLPKCSRVLRPSEGEAEAELDYELDLGALEHPQTSPSKKPGLALGLSFAADSHPSFVKEPRPGPGPGPGSEPGASAEPNTRFHPAMPHPVMMDVGDDGGHSFPYADADTISVRKQATMKRYFADTPIARVVAKPRLPPAPLALPTRPLRDEKPPLPFAGGRESPGEIDEVSESVLCVNTVQQFRGLSKPTKQLTFGHL